jgi:hypothetical protein
MEEGGTGTTFGRPASRAAAATSVAVADRSASGSDILAHQCSLAASHPVISLQAEVDARPFPRRVQHTSWWVCVSGLRISQIRLDESRYLQVGFISRMDWVIALRTGSSPQWTGSSPNGLGHRPGWTGSSPY